MKIKELRLKNFGKFTNKEIHFSDGMNVIYGENESGKSTLYTFIRAMLFGLERGIPDGSTGGRDNRTGAVCAYGCGGPYPECL